MGVPIVAGEINSTLLVKCWIIWNDFPLNIQQHSYWQDYAILGLTDNRGHEQRGESMSMWVCMWGSIIGWPLVWDMNAPKPKFLLFVNMEHHHFSLAYLHRERQIFSVVSRYYSPQQYCLILRPWSPCCPLLKSRGQSCRGMETSYCPLKLWN